MSQRIAKVFTDFDSALEHLKSETTLSPSALGALSGANRKNLAAFAQTWVALPAERRRRVSQMLVDMAEENIELDYNLLFRYLLNDEDGQVRAHGIEGLWEDEDISLVKPLVGFLRSDPDASVRAAAADSLGRFVLLAEYGRLESHHTDLIHEALLATLRSGVEALGVRCRSIEALGYSSRENMRATIANAYADREDAMRVSAVAAMGHSADTYWREIAATELESSDPRMRFEAARATGELEYRTAVPRLVELLDDPDREVQMAAITALGQIGGPRAKKALVETASSDDEVLSELADEALQELEFASNSDLLLMDIQSDEDADLDDDLEEE